MSQTLKSIVSVAFLFLVSSLVAESVQAQAPLDYTIHQLYVAPRQLSAGDTFSGADDFNAVMYNPAATAWLKEGQLNMWLSGALTGSFQTMAKSVTDASNNSTDPTTSMFNLLGSLYGNSYGIRFPNLGAIWARPGWGVAILPIDLSIGLSLHQQLGPQLQVSAYQDTTVAFNMSKSLMGDQLAVGVTAKAVYRGGVGQSILAADLATNPNFFTPSQAKEGLTIDADVGANYRMPVPTEGFLSFLQYAKPTFAAVIRNIADYGFAQNMHLYGKDTSSNPAKLQRRIDLGGAFELPSFWVFFPRLMIDQRDILHDYWSFTKGLHIGAELKWHPYSWLNGYYSLGLSQGYLTGGLGAELAWFRLDFSTWGEEMGTSDAKLQNRFYMVRLSLDF